MSFNFAEEWGGELADLVAELIAIPSVSPSFDPQWADHNYLRRAVDVVAERLGELLPAGSVLRVLELPGRSPLLIGDVPSTVDAPTVLCYGHLDVQPEGQGWTRTSAFVPYRSGDLLIGRGGGDDGYAPYLAAAVLRRLERRPRTILLFETSEESSSVDLPAYLDAYRDDLGDPALVLCLDAFVPDNDRLWVTTSMRGIIVADLSVSLYQNDVHSGLFGGVAPSSFRILRQLLDRIEEAATGTVIADALRAEVPEVEIERLQNYADNVRGDPFDGVPALSGVVPAQPDRLSQLRAQCWEPSISYTGIDGAPPTTAAGSVLRAGTTVRLSIRIPPGVDAAVACGQLREVLTTEPPSGAEVGFNVIAAESGWLGAVPPDIATALRTASCTGYGHDVAYCACGATIPFLGMFTARFPDSVVLPIGLLTAESNAHGPNEELDLVAAAKLSAAVATLIDKICQEES